MVKLWPFSGDNNSAASFERTLSTLATKIQRTTAKNDVLRQRSRKLKVGWTLYGGFTYILTVLIFILVTGWREWGAFEYTIVSGGPIVLWGVRRAVTSWYEYWIGRNSVYLEELGRERDETIEKLKRATRYDSTQELIEKYGASSKGNTPKTMMDGEKGAKKRQSTGAQAHQGQGQQRVFIQPPPTANIPRGPPQPQPQQQPQTASRPTSPPLPPPSSPLPTEEFAPNAFTSPPPPSAQQALSSPPTYGTPTWYDRILDALLGEDETSAKNRFALICQHCKLVNGQAPPGARTLEDVGRWRCVSCGGMNGVESEVGRLVERVKRKEVEVEGLDVPDVDGEGAGEVKVASSSEEDETLETTPAASTRSKKKSGGGKKG